MPALDTVPNRYVSGDRDQTSQKTATLPMFDEVYNVRRQADAYLPNATDLPISRNGDTVMSNTIEYVEPELSSDLIAENALKRLEINGFSRGDLAYDPRRAMKPSR